MGLVTLAALVLCGAYLWRFSDDRGVVPFLLGCALLAVGVLHAVAWRESRSPLLIVDLTGLRVRLGGHWTGVPWPDVETLEVAGRGRVGDGRITVRPRDELRVLADAGPRARVAVLLNRWLYDAPLVVPFGLTTTLSTTDVLGTLTRLADGRAAVVAVGEQDVEPDPTVEVARPGSLRHDDGHQPPAGGQGPGRADAPPAPRRLAAVVSALRTQAGRLSEVTVPIRREVTVGTLALASDLGEETEPLPELAELRRRAPEEDERPDERPGEHPDERPGGRDPELVAVGRPSPRTANVELIIDATTDLSAQAMRKVRQRPDATAQPSAIGVADSVEVVGPTPTFDTPPNEVIGLELGRAREWLGMTVDDLAERTRIRPYVIESVEIGDFSPCGGDFYARGHLRMLANVLGVDPEPLVASYDAHLASAPVGPRAVFGAELTAGVIRPAGRGGSRWGVLVGAVLVLLLVWGLARFFLADPASAPDALGAPTHNSAGLGSPGPGNTLLIPPPVPPTRVTLSVQRGSSRVVVWDKADRVVYRGILAVGDTKVVRGRGPLRVMAVNGGAVWMTGPGHPRGLLGAPGARVFRHIG